MLFGKPVEIVREAPAFGLNEPAHTFQMAAQEGYLASVDDVVKDQDSHDGLFWLGIRTGTQAHGGAQLLIGRGRYTVPAAGLHGLVVPQQDVFGGKRPRGHARRSPALADGVRTSDGRVTILALPGTRLTGELPPELGDIWLEKTLPQQ